MRERKIGLMCCSWWLRAPPAANHWTVDPHAYQYDMTVNV